MVEIREAIQADAAEIAVLLGDLGYPVSAEEAASRLSALSATGEDEVLLAEEEGRALGLVALRRLVFLHLAEPVARITALVVRQGLRSRGIGALLLDEAVARAARAGCTTIELTSGVSRARAHEFYKARGFQVTSLRLSRRIGE